MPSEERVCTLRHPGPRGLPPIVLAIMDGVRETSQYLDVGRPITASLCTYSKLPSNIRSEPGIVMIWSRGMIEIWVCSASSFEFDVNSGSGLGRLQARSKDRPTMSPRYH